MEDTAYLRRTSVECVCDGLYGDFLKEMFIYISQNLSGQAFYRRMGLGTAMEPVHHRQQHDEASY